MTRAEQYRHLANEVRARASNEANPIVRAEWDTLAENYIRLAEQSETTGQPIYDPLAEILKP